jgi:hypothetical protein
MLAALGADGCVQIAGIIRARPASEEAMGRNFMDFRTYPRANVKFESATLATHDYAFELSLNPKAAQLLVATGCGGGLTTGDLD